MRIFAKTISYLFHPLFMSIIGVLLILNMNIFIPYSGQEAIRFIMIVLALATLLLPLSLIPFYLYQGIIGSIEMADRKERFVPLLITSLIYYLTYLLLQRLMITEIILAFILASAATIFVIALITNYLKISIHMAGLGGITGLLLYLSISFHLNIPNHFIVVILVSGLTGMARLMLNSHKPSEIYTGWGIGLVTVSFVMNMYLNM